MYTYIHIAVCDILYAEQGTTSFAGAAGASAGAYGFRNTGTKTQNHPDKTV